MNDASRDASKVEMLSDCEVSLLFNRAFREYFYLFRSCEKDMQDYRCPFAYFKSINRDLTVSFPLLRSEEQKEDEESREEDEINLNVHERYTKKKSEVVNSLIKCFRIVAYFVEKNSFFSSNEELDDISTSSLKYILTSFLLGHLSCESPDIELRQTRLKHAIIYLKQYLSTLEVLGLMRLEDMKVWIRKNDDSQEEEQQDNKFNLHTKSVFSRNEKIDRARYEDAADKKIISILKERQALLEDEFDLDKGDENTQRDLLITIIQRFGAEALTHLDLSNEELNLLRNSHFADKKALKKKELNEGNNKTKLDVYSARNSNDLRLFYRKIIFTPDYILPSVSLAECAAREMELEVKILGKQKTKKKDEEEEELKARKWDDWKDENPKGIGNKMKNVG